MTETYKGVFTAEDGEEITLKWVAKTPPPSEIVSYVLTVNGEEYYCGVEDIEGYPV